MTIHSRSQRTQETAKPWQPVWEIICFELQEGIHKRFVPICFMMFFGMGLLAAHIYGMDAVLFTFIREAFGESTRQGELVFYANSPLRIMNVIANIMPLLVLVTVGVFAERATKDFTCGMDGLLFTSPIKEWQFATGRLIASLLLSLFIAMGLGLGLLIGQALPWMATDRIGPFNVLGFIQPYGYLVIPNLLIFGVFSFALGLLTRRTLPSYLGLVATLITVGIVQVIFDIFNLPKFFDAFLNTTGVQAVNYTTQFWTKVQQNALNVPFAPIIWLSRLMYLGLIAVFFAWAWQRFSFSGPPANRPNPRLQSLLEWMEQRLMFWKSARQPEPNERNAMSRAEAMAQPVVSLHYGALAQLQHIWHIAYIELQRQLGNPLILAVLIIAIFGSVFSLSFAMFDGTGAVTLPATELLVQLLSFVMGLLGPLLIIFMAGDLVWRERDASIDALCDPLPINSWVWISGKLLALMLIFMMVLLLMVCASVLTQTLSHYTHFDLNVYAIGLFSITWLNLLLIGVLAITIQVLANHKFLGYFLSAVLIMAFSQDSLFENFRLLQYGYTPDAHYSQMNGYERMLEPVRWFQSYWLMIALLLLCIAALFWIRGVDAIGKTRWRIASQRFTRPIQAVMSMSAITAFCLGSWIFYNTHILNSHLSLAQAEVGMLAYEKAFGHLIDAQPKITNVKLHGDLYTGNGARFALRGTYTLQNETQKPITTILLNVLNTTYVNKITVNGKPANNTVQAPSLQGYAFNLATPLMPGETLQATFDLLMKPALGFTGEKPDLSQLRNSININSSKITPLVGFSSERITDNTLRLKLGLPPFDRAATIAKASQSGARRPDAHRVQFSATLSTSLEQIAITSGELMREWAIGNRRYFHYQSQQPIQYDVTFLSGRYSVRRDKWNDIPIEVYHHPGHDRNLPRIISGVKAGLDYASKNFSPYPHKSLRLVEVPYVTEAISYPSVITMGERFGFLANINDKDSSRIDNVFRIAAHEVAHQWWGQQLMPAANFYGARILTEALAEYTSYQVFAKKYGEQKLGIALHQNMNVYLKSRNQSDVPLVTAIANPLVYQKGSIAMYALQDYLGEEVVNLALAKFLNENSNVPPYPLSQDLVNALRQASAPEYQYLITDLFETVTLYNNKAESVVSTQRPDGRYDVTLTLQSGKAHSDKNGNETSVKMNDDIDVGLYDAAGKLIYLNKHRFKGGKTEITIAVDTQPRKAGIDPLHKLIDKFPDDNVTNIDAVIK